MISKYGRTFGGRCSVPLESHRRPLVGTALAVIAAIGFALSNTMASLAYEGGSNPLTVAALRFFLPAIVLVAWLRVERISLSLSGRDAWIAILLGVLTAQYTWALLVAIHLIPLALAVLLLYLFPFLTTIILVLFGWDKVSLRATAAIAVAFAGLVLALEPRSGGANFFRTGARIQRRARACTGHCVVEPGIRSGRCSAADAMDGGRSGGASCNVMRGARRIPVATRRFGMDRPCRRDGALRIRDDQLLCFGRDDRAGPCVPPLICRAGRIRPSWHCCARPNPRAGAVRGHCARHRGTRRCDGSVSGTVKKAGG
jgi:EamA-like transporter family